MNQLIFPIIITVFFIIFIAYLLVKGKYLQVFGVESFQDGIPLLDTEIYLINLENNTDRLEFFIEQYMNSDLKYKKFNRVNAIDGKTLNIKEYVSPRAYLELQQIEKNGFRTKHYQLTRGAVGCYLSHMLTYETFIEDNDKDYGLIFEDDVKIDPKFFYKLNKALPSIPNDWDILLLSCYCIKCEKKDVYYNTERFWWLNSYVIKRESAKKILDILKNKLIEQQIDSELSDMIIEDKIKIYCLKDSISRQTGVFDTTIQMPLKEINGINPYATL